MTVAVVICAYTLDRWNLLVRAVESVTAQDLANELILVVDHNDELLARARDRWPSLRAIANAGERGLSGARNSGVAATTGDVIAFLDDDAVAPPEWLRNLVAPLAQPSVGLTAGRVLPEWEGGQPDWFPDEFLWVVGCSYTGLPTGPADLRNPIGASMAVRRQVFADVGLFHSGVGRVGRGTGGCEETELGIRARSAGWTTRYAPASQIHHRVPLDRHAFRYFARRCWSEGRAKAMVATLAGAGDALEAERTYATKAIPRGIVEHLRGNRGSRIRGTLATMSGCAVTAAGYLTGRLGGPRLDDLAPAPRLLDTTPATRR